MLGSSFIKPHSSVILRGDAVFIIQPCPLVEPSRLEINVKKGLANINQNKSLCISTCLRLRILNVKECIG
jgi:hypothetical protein